MAEIKPLRAWRYNESLAENIEVLTSPLFDVVSEKHGGCSGCSGSNPCQ